MVAVALFIANSLASPYFLSPWSLSDATFNFTEKAIIALASTAMGFALQFGVGTPGLVAIALATGAAGLASSARYAPTTQDGIAPKGALPPVSSVSQLKA